MSDEFKCKLLRYLTGNLEQEQGDNEPQPEQTETITNNIKTYVLENFFGYSSPYIQAIIKGNNSDNYLCYGRGSDEDGTLYGFMIILNANFQIIQSTKNYSSGSRMGEFLGIFQDNDGSFYGIEKTYDIGTNRFIILNNILIKNETQTNYQFKLQKSYNIPTTLSELFRVDGIIKNENGAQYLIYGTTSNNNYYKPIAIEFCINVGSENEWIEYTCEIEETQDYYVNSISCFVQWDDSNDINIIMAVSRDSYIYLFQNNNEILENYKTYNLGLSTNYTLSPIITNQTNIYVYVAYRVFNNIGTMEDKQVSIYRINNDIVKKIYESEIATGPSYNFLDYGYYINQTNVSFYFNMPVSTNYEKYKYFGGMIVEDKVYFPLEIEINISDISNIAFHKSFNTYNLYTYVLQIGDILYKVPFVFNQFNYNGAPYENINSLVPHQGILYDNNDKIIFARNLYNRNVNANRTVSTFEIPNTLLNNMVISTQKLISENNDLLVEREQSITKNIYESLYLNFYNTLIMKNSNNNQEIINSEGASRLNNSISNLNDYQESRATKIRIIYSDGTKKTVDIEIPTIENNTATYKFAIYVDKSINSIQIISEDENTIYQEINNLNLEINKYYLIKQDVKIE